MEAKIDSEKRYNFLINASNQANMTGASNTSPMQINSLFVFIEPYKLDKYILEDEMNIEIQVDEQGTFRVNGEQVNLIEIEPGISIFGIIKREQEK